MRDTLRDEVDLALLSIYAGKDFNPDQPRDPHSGEWVDVPGTINLIEVQPGQIIRVLRTAAKNRTTIEVIGYIRHVGGSTHLIDGRKVRNFGKPDEWYGSPESFALSDRDPIELLRDIPKP